jgi:hypothetical protein
MGRNGVKIGLYNGLGGFMESVRKEMRDAFEKITMRGNKT